MFKNFTKRGINHIFSRDTAIINEEPKNDNCLDVKVFSSEMNDKIYDKIKIEDEFTNNSLQTENIASTIQNYEGNYFDDKVLVCETTINLRDFGSKDYIEDDQVKQCEIFALNNIDMKFSQPQEYHNKVKVENQIIAPNNIKIEFYNEELFCHQCNESYQLYCTKCQMLVHILNRSTITMHNKAEDDVPNNILEIRETLGYFGIFALTVIPRGVKFGPFTGLSVSKCTWRLKGGKLVVDDNESKFPCWMQYINFARSISDQNLLVFQYENDLYYRSTREILEGEELLVYFGDEYENLYNNVEMNFTLAPEKNMEDVFACTFCCLGFNAKEYLIKHKSICLNGINENYSIKEIMQCPFCKIHLDQQEYLEHHRNYCLNKTSREYSLPSLSNQRTSERTEERKICKPHCKYEDNPKNYFAKHYKGGVYNCEICNTTFKRKQALKIHVFKVHIDFEDKETNSYLKTHLKANHFKEGKYKCTECEYETCINSQFKNHLLSHQEVKRFKYKCSKCKFETSLNFFLNHHMCKHDNVKSLKCSECKYETNSKSHLNRHMIEKHSEVKKYECSLCGFGASCKSSLKSHLYTHEKEKRLQCTECEFKTNKLSNLTRHIKTIHCEVKKYNCSVCEFKTNYEPYLKSHMNAKHCEEKKFRCSKCEFETSYKSSLTYHLHWHDNVKHFKCAQCNYGTNSKSHLNRHVNARHCKTKKK